MEKNNWLCYDVPLYWEEEAREIRKGRDLQYGNIYIEENSDLRWVGDLGEICFNSWMKDRGITELQWHRNNAAGAPDFTINNLSIDVKTVKRKVPPKPSYTAQITAIHATHAIDELFFMSYEFQLRKLWLLGGLRMEEFISKATYFKENDYVHPNYQIRKGHEIYNAEISILEPPDIWINKLLHPGA